MHHRLCLPRPQQPRLGLRGIYKNALLMELEDHGVHGEPELPLPVSYKMSIIGECRSDIVIANLLVVELKAQEGILPGHISQLRAYLRCSRIENGLLLNFGPRQVDVKRVIESRKEETGKTSIKAG